MPPLPPFGSAYTHFHLVPVAIQVDKRSILFGGWIRLECDNDGVRQRTDITFSESFAGADVARVSLSRALSYRCRRKIVREIAKRLLRA